MDDCLTPIHPSTHPFLAACLSRHAGKHGCLPYDSDTGAVWALSATGPTSLVLAEHMCRIFIYHLLGRIRAGRGERVADLHLPCIPCSMGRDGSKARETFRIALRAFCPMPNHFRLYIATPEANLSRSTPCRMQCLAQHEGGSAPRPSPLQGRRERTGTGLVLVAPRPGKGPGQPK